MTTFGGMSVTVVEPGTTVGLDKDAEPLIVTDSTAMFKGSQMWVTQTMYDKLKEHTK